MSIALASGSNGAGILMRLSPPRAPPAGPAAAERSLRRSSLPGLDCISAKLVSSTGGAGGAVSKSEVKLGGRASVARGLSGRRREVGVGVKGNEGWVATEDETLLEARDWSGSSRRGEAKSLSSRGRGGMMGEAAGGTGASEMVDAVVAVVALDGRRSIGRVGDCGSASIACWR